MYIYIYIIADKLRLRLIGYEKLSYLVFGDYELTHNRETSQPTSIKRWLFLLAFHGKSDMWERFNDYPGIPSNMTSTHPMQTLGRSTYQNVGTYEYHMLSSVNMFKYNGEKWFIPSPSHPPKLNYTHFTGNMFYDFTMCLAGHGFER